MRRTSSAMRRPRVSCLSSRSRTSFGIVAMRSYYPQIAGPGRRSPAGRLLKMVMIFSPSPRSGPNRVFKQSATVVAHQCQRAPDKWRANCDPLEEVVETPFSICSDGPSCSPQNLTSGPYISRECFGVIRLNQVATTSPSAARLPPTDRVRPKRSTQIHPRLDDPGLEGFQPGIERHARRRATALQGIASPPDAE